MKSILTIILIGITIWIGVSVVDVFIRRQMQKEGINDPKSKRGASYVYQKENGSFWSNDVIPF